MSYLWKPDRNKRATHTTPFSQMTLMRSWMPGSPWGIFVKSSLPMALCLMVNGRWSDPTTFRVSLRSNGARYKVTFITAAVEETIKQHSTSYSVFLTFPAGSSGNWEYLDPDGEEARWHGQQHGPSPDDNTACRSAQRGLWSSRRGPPYLWSDSTIWFLDQMIVQRGRDEL